MNVRRTTLPIAISTLVFVIGLLVSLFTNSSSIDGSYTLSDGQAIGEYEFQQILSNNLYAAVVLVVGGIVAGTPTFVVLLNNAFLLGTLVSSASTRYGYRVVCLLLLPHGIFEIPAIIIAGAAGFKIPYEIVRYLLGKKDQPLTKEDIKEYVTLALISIILIVIAAWIEANITLKMAKAMLNSTRGI